VLWPWGCPLNIHIVGSSCLSLLMEWQGSRSHSNLSIFSSLDRSLGPSLFCTWSPYLLPVLAHALWWHNLGTSAVLEGPCRDVNPSVLFFLNSSFQGIQETCTRLYCLKIAEVGFKQGVLEFCGCCNKLPQTGWLKTIEMYSSIVLEIINLRSRPCRVNCSWRL
jgi:hypothetical protein